LNYKLGGGRHEREGRKTMRPMTTLKNIFVDVSKMKTQHIGKYFNIIYTQAEPNTPYSSRLTNK
jgi:hypothetical protein